MRYIQILIPLFIGMLSVCMADDVSSPQTTSIDIDAQIAKIQTAPAEERVMLMNELKKSIAAMNEAERAAAISQLQSKMRRQAAQNPAVSHMQTRVQEMQVQASEHVMQMQQMNQDRVADQIHSVVNTMDNVMQVTPTTMPTAPTTMPTAPTTMPTAPSTNTMSFPR